MFPEAAEQDCWVGTGPRVGTDKLTVVGEQGLGDLREEEKEEEKGERETEKEEERRNKEEKGDREGMDSTSGVGRTRGGR